MPGRTDPPATAGKLLLLANSEVKEGLMTEIPVINLGPPMILKRKVTTGGLDRVLCRMSTRKELDCDVKETQSNPLLTMISFLLLINKDYTPFPIHFHGNKLNV